MGKLKFEGVTVSADRVECKQGSGPLAGARALVESSGQLTRRITVTRMAVTGPFALALRKKKDERELFLTIEGDGFGFCLAVDPKKGREARDFAARLNAAAGDAARRTAHAS